MRRIRSLFLALAVIATGTGAMAAEAVVAVASNFLTAAERLETGFEAATGHQVTLVHGSTGKIYGQIVNGAPFDLFLSADTARPRRLVDEGLAAEARIYAIGALVLVAHEPLIFPNGLTGRRIAIANPDLAPFGAAASEVLAGASVTGAVTVLTGDNVGQAAAMFFTRNAEVAFLAQSQLIGREVAFALPMAGRHAPIAQSAARLTRGTENAAARAFWDYLFSPQGQALIAEAGYGGAP